MRCSFNGHGPARHVSDLHRPRHRLGRGLLLQHLFPAHSIRCPSTTTELIGNPPKPVLHQLAHVWSGCGHTARGKLFSTAPGTSQPGSPCSFIVMG